MSERDHYTDDGDFYRDWEDCSRCDGAGWEYLEDFDRDGNQRTERCSRCAGTGRVRAE